MLRVCFQAHTYIRTNVFTIIGMQGAFRNWNVFKRCFSLRSKKIEENQFSAKPIKVESRQFHTNFSKHRNDFFTFKFYFLILDKLRSVGSKILNYNKKKDLF